MRSVAELEGHALSCPNISDLRADSADAVQFGMTEKED